MEFINEISKNKRNKTNSHLREAWVFSAAMALVEACTNATSPSSPIFTPTTQESIDCLLADLIYQARTKLDILGREFGLLPKSANNTPKFGSPSPNRPVGDEKPIQSEPKPAFSNPVLQDAMQSEELFDKLYLDIQASLWERAGEIH
jgi:hypothetical protein